MGVSIRDRDSMGNWLVTPIPFSTDFDIYYDGYVGPVGVELINLYGQVVWKETGWFQQHKKITPGVALQPGVYLLRLNYGETSYSTKIVRSVKY